MAFPPETPQDYCDYFQHLVLYDTPPEPKWNSGLKASQLWRDYWEQGGTENYEILVSIVKILMPVRQRGSVLLDLCQRILGHVAKLPVGVQKEIWLEVFNVDNQGEDPITHNEVAREILQDWVELDNNAESAPISKTMMMNMVDRIHVHAFSGNDWIAFTVAISEWFKKYIAEPSFFDSVIGRMKRKADGLEAA